MSGAPAAIDTWPTELPPSHSAVETLGRLRDHVRKHNRRVGTETGIAVGVGLFESALLFGGTYALVAWLMAIRTPSTQPPRDPWTIVLAGTGGFYLLSSAWAWWRLRRFKRVELWHNEHDPLRYAIDSTAMATSESQLGKVWLQALITAPIFLVKAPMIWRRRVRFTDGLLARAHAILIQARDGEPDIRPPDAAALRILRRTGLVKADRGNDGRLRVWITGAGIDLIDQRHVAH